MRPAPEYVERFSVDRGGNLVRSVTPAPGKGQPYEHRCARQSFEEVADAADEIGMEGITLDKLVQRTKLPSSQINVALAFMKERGCVYTESRINYPASGNRRPGALSNDAMIEYWALAEDSPGSQPPREGESGDSTGEPRQPSEPQPPSE